MVDEIEKLSLPSPSRPSSHPSSNQLKTLLSSPSSTSLLLLSSLAASFKLSLRVCAFCRSSSRPSLPFGVCFARACGGRFVSCAWVICVDYVVRWGGVGVERWNRKYIRASGGSWTGEWETRHDEADSPNGARKWRNNIPPQPSQQRSQPLVYPLYHLPHHRRRAFGPLLQQGQEGYCLSSAAPARAGSGSWSRAFVRGARRGRWLVLRAGRWRWRVYRRGCPSFWL